MDLYTVNTYFFLNATIIMFLLRHAFYLSKRVIKRRDLLLGYILCCSELLIIINNLLRKYQLLNTIR